MITQKLPKIVFFDIDDTLYLKDRQCVPDSVFVALKALKRQGVLLAIATGRSVAIFPPAICRLIDEMGVDILVTINGQYVSHLGERLVHFPLSCKQVASATDVIMAQPNAGFAYMTADKIWALATNPTMTQVLTQMQIDYQMTTLVDFDKDLPIYQMLAFYQDNRQVCLELPKLKVGRWHIGGMDILDINGSKARGIGAVLDSLGIDLADAWAFGDGLNDIEMLQAVGFGVAMGNAHPKLQAVADFVCPKACDDGIYRALATLGVI